MPSTAITEGKIADYTSTKVAHPWHWRSIPLNQRTGQDIFAALFLDGPTNNPSTSSNQNKLNGTGAIATLLESPYPTYQFCATAQKLSRYSICAGPPRWVNGQPRLWTPPVGEGLPWLKRLHQLHRSQRLANEGLPPDSNLPFQGGWLGWLGYDLAWEVEQLPYLRNDPLPFPVVYWYEPEQFAVLDHRKQQLWLATTQRDDLDLLQKRLDNSPLLPAIDPPKSHNPRTVLQSLVADDRLQFHSTQRDYMAAVRRAKEHIREGDIFQANLSLRFSTPSPSDSWSLYRTLQAINPSPFASYWRSPWGDVVSCSPERLLSVAPDTPTIIGSRPIAGTRSRGANAAEDRALAQELSTDAKERAEHAMLVDLERNDLGRVCAWGSVSVDEFFTVERYSHVMHLVSNVVGELAEDADAIDAIRALFPGGTITGCPKVRCMEIIEALEPVRRSLFYGSFGYIDHRGQLDLNIAIRTLLMPVEENVNGRGERSQIIGQVGAGIVADSDPEREWQESLLKAAAQLSAIGSQSQQL
ncbi:MAG: anthranilate synthase component I [Cyanobacteria bacterium P01_F01_bin.153]